MVRLTVATLTIFALAFAVEGIGGRSLEGAKRAPRAAAAADVPQRTVDADDAEKKPSDADDKSTEASKEKVDADKDSDSKDDDSKKGSSKEKPADKEADSPKEADAEEKSEKSEAKKAGDEKEAEKPAAAKSEKKPAPKKPETYKVKTKDLTIDVETEGVFVADDSEEVPLRPETWSTFKVVEAVEHGARVRKGDVLVKFDARDIDKAIADKALDQRLGEVALMEAEEDFPRLEKSVELDFEVAERDYNDARDEYDRFKKTMRALSEKIAEYNLKSADQSLDNAQEELSQLEKMYTADELTEETEEIVLRRQRFEVEMAKFYVEYSKINHEYTLNVSIPNRDIALKTAVEQARLALQEAKTAKTLGLSEKRFALQALRERRARSVEENAKLVADRALMTLKAPIDGIVYYGRCVNGRWAEVSSYESKLIPFGSVQPNAVLMTVVGERPLYVEASVGEKDVPSVKDDQKVVVIPVADDDVELAAKVKSVADIPGSGNQFTVRIDLKSDDPPKWLKAGMTGKAKIRVYTADDAVVIPADLVQSDEEKPKSKYVMLQVEGEKKPVRREIKLGKTKDKDVEVLRGLEAGDLIVKGAKDKPDEDDANDSDKD